jgi:hypothetical protein
MLESITIITLCVLFLIFFRPGKTPPLDSPLDIERPGKYHMTLAPKLNLAQPFIESIIKELGTAGDTSQSSATQCFEVHDKRVTAHGHGFYLLAITQRKGMLYFQAIAPRQQLENGESHQNILLKATHAALANASPDESHNAETDERIVAAIENAAHQHQIEIKRLSA